jgi:molybdopterin molybdotransferase
MLTVEEAVDQILSRIRVLESEHVDLLRAQGRVLAAPVVSRRRIPPWPNSSMDGYALRAADATAPAARLRVSMLVPAGVLPETPLAAGEAARIFTGAPLPPGADTVIPQEDVTVDGDVITLARPVRPGDCVRPAGEDVAPGDVVAEPGREVGPPEIAMLATLGYTGVRVYRRPRVAILSTGDELADLGSEPGPGQIPNSNSYALIAQVREAGGEPTNLGVARDRRDDIEDRLRWGREADVLLTSAGVSVGDYDFVKAGFTALGATLHLWKVSMRPGKPITFGSLGDRAVFGLPGNPVSAMVTFELFVRPALRKMAGHRQLARPTIRARALAPIPNPGSRRGYLRVTLRAGPGGEYGARLTGDQGSGIIKSMVLADGLAVVPPDTTVEPGAAVDVMVLR